MTMKLYDTLTRSIQDVTPIDGTVTMYTCGPTVYDYPHIGNWYAFIRWDMLHRALQADGYATKWIMNITDVGHLVSDADDGEDKLEKGAKRENKTAWDVAEFYGNYFTKGLQRLGFSEYFMLPKATDHIAEQIDLVSKLEAKGVTYAIDDGIYFDTSKIKNYGKLAHLNLEEQIAGARVEVNIQKRNAADFALWKLSSKDEKRDMEWESPWGKGFPGWHIECSAMSKKYLGDTMSIHAGGIDHIPVHHTNEIAQSETANGKQMALTWVHSNFILVDGKKMSKSANNFYTLEDIEQKGFSPLDFRLAVIGSHYQSEAEFSWDTMHAAKIRLQRFKQAADLRFQTNNSTKVHIFDTNLILSAVTNNLNTPEALSLADTQIQSYLSEGISNDQIIDFTNYLKFLDDIFGLCLLTSKDIDTNIKDLITLRKEARLNKDWQQSDDLRDKLAEHGVKIRDTSAGQIWSWL